MWVSQVDPPIRRRERRRIGRHIKLPHSSRSILIFTTVLYGSYLLEPLLDTEVHWGWG